MRTSGRGKTCEKLEASLLGLDSLSISILLVTMRYSSDLNRGSKGIEGRDGTRQVEMEGISRNERKTKRVIVVAVGVTGDCPLLLNHSSRPRGRDVVNNDSDSAASGDDCDDDHDGGDVVDVSPANHAANLCPLPHLPHLRQNASPSPSRQTCNPACVPSQEYCFHRRPQSLRKGRTPYTLQGRA